jgi:hypothetical protein
MLPTISFGQSKMVCDQKYNGLTVYKIKTKNIKSVSQLPVRIQNNLRGYLKQALGSIYDSVGFSHGQIIDLRKNFKHDTAVYRQEWIATKYELNFLIHDISIGIKNYYISIKMDAFGQVVFSNWPRHSFSDRQKLSQLWQIEELALKIASQKKFNIQDYTATLEYDNKLDRLCWCFYFIHELEKSNKTYNVILIDWSNHNIIDDSQIRD